MKNTTLYIQDRHFEMVRDVIINHYPNAKVVAYGSRVNGNDITAHEGSDLDLAIIDFGNPHGNILALREAFSESNIPFLIDIFDYNKLPINFKQEIDKKNFRIL